MKATFTSWLMLLVAVLSAQVFASPSHDWIIAQQTPGGAFANTSPIGTDVQSTAEALTAFNLDNISAPTKTQAARVFIADVIDGHTEYLARSIIAQADAGVATQTFVTDLFSRQNRDGGWGTYLSFESDPLSTAWALRAFGATQINTTAVANALAYLLNKQSSDGGWRLDGVSSVALTSEVLLTLNAYPRYAGVTAAINAGRAFLLQHKQADSLWGQSFESALALSALSLGANSSADFDLSINALKARMNDGTNSWHNDVYTTALVLQALKRVSALGIGNSAKGAVQGQIVAVASTQAIAGATISVANSSLSIVSDTNGKFLLDNLPAGPQTLIIQKPGYSPTSVAVIIEKATTTEAGKIALGQIQSSVFVKGHIFESGNLQKIANASIALTGAKAISLNSDANGTFEFANLPLGNYSFTINASGFYPVTGSFILAAGKNLHINQPLVATTTPLVNDPAALQGLVLDAITQTPIAAAKVWVDDVLVTTQIDGRFKSAPVVRGAHQVRIAASGYVDGQYNIIFPAGASGDLGTLLLNAASSSQAATTLQILSNTSDSVSGKTIAGAFINVISAGVLVVTDTQGKAVVNGLTELSQNIEVSAPGYWSQTYQLQASGFGSITTAFKLLPKAPDATAFSLSGLVLDQDTQIPIVGAAVLVDNTHQAVTDSLGRYSLLNLQGENTVVEVSALGYSTIKRAINLGQTPGQYTLDLSVAKDVTSSLISVVSVDAPSSVSPDTQETVRVVLDNLTAEVQNALLFVRIIDSEGQQQGLLTALIAGTDEFSPTINLAAGARVTFSLPWSVDVLPMGGYTLSAEVVEIGTQNRDLPKGKIIARGVAETVVAGVAKFTGALAIDPPLTQAGATTPLTLKALVRNAGNQPLPAGDYQIKITETQGNSVFHSSTITFAETLEQNAVGNLDFGSWVPGAAQVGALKVVITRLDGIAGNIAGDLYVGDVAKGLFTLDQSVLPEGNSVIKGNIRLTGVDTKIGTSVDPLFVLVKDAVAKGAAYTGTEAMTWNQSKNCLGCHIQTQSLAGLGAASLTAPVNKRYSNYLFNAISTAQRETGGIENSYPQHTVVETLFATWALTEWPDQRQSYRTLIKAMDHLWGRRAISSDRVWWNNDHQTGWLRSPLAATALTALTASRTLDVAAKLADLPDTDYRFGPAIPLDPGAPIEQTMAAGTDGIYVAKNNGWMEKVDPTAGTTQVLFTSVAGVSGRISGLLLDANNTFWLTTDQGKLLNVSQSGQVVASFAICGRRSGGLAQAPNGDKYMVCHDEGYIQRITPSGQVQSVASAGLFDMPYGITWHPDGFLLVANYLGNNLLQVTIGGDVSIYAEGLMRPLHPLVLPSGEVFVTSSFIDLPSPDTTDATPGVDRIRLDRTAERVAGNIQQPWALVSYQDRVYVSSRHGNRLNTIEEVPLNTQVLNSYKADFPKIANYLLASVNLNDAENSNQALALIGLGEVRKQLTAGDQLTQVDSSIAQIAALLKTRQAPGGGWALSGIATNSTRDPLPTALVGIALEYTSPSSQDPMIRNAITYLLGSQLADGIWKTTTKLFPTDLGTTSLVMVYMPKALDRIGGLDVKLALTMPANISLQNPTLPPTSSQVGSNGGMQYLWDLKGVTGNGRDIGFDLSIQNLLLNESRPVATLGTLSFNNSFTDEVIVAPLTIPKVTAASQLTLSLATDKTTYSANEAVVITPLVKNLGPAFAGGQLKLSIRAAADLGSLANLPALGVDPLASQQQQSLLSGWNTGTTLAGAYQVYGQLYDQQNRLVAEAVAPLAIQATLDDTSAGGSQSLGALVFTDKPNYSLAEVVQLDLRTLNFTTNDIHQPTLGKLVIKNAAGDTVFGRSYAIPQLVASERFIRPERLDLTGKTLGSYQVTWQVFDAAGVNELARAQAQFTVINDLRLAIAGNVTVAKNQVEKGSAQSCTFTTTNNGATTLNNLAVTTSVVDVSNQLSVEAQNHNITLNTLGVDSKVNNFATPSLAVGDYGCVLEAVLEGKTQVLANALFKVIESPVKLTGDIQLGTKPRLLVLLDPSSTPALAAEEAYLRQLLTQAGWFFTLVNTATDFKTELTDGGYSEYALLSEGVTLDAATLAQLKNNLAQGDGLVVAGSRDRRHQVLEESLGIVARANSAYAKGVGIKQSVVSAPWEQVFDKSSRVLNFTATSASVIGDYRNTLPGADPKTLLGSLGSAGGFNGYWFEDFISSVSSVEGRVAAGGNFNIVYYGIGNKLPASPLSDVMVIGGNVTFPNGKIYNGSLLAGGSVAGVSSGVRSGVAAGAQVLGNTSLPLDFAGERSYLEELSRNIANFTPNGKTTLQYGGYTLKGDCASNLQVFTLNASDFANANSLSLNCIPANATVVLNITGPLVKIQNIGLQALASMRQKVLFNFPTATRVEVYWVGIEGSILAPLADFVNPQGNTNGQVIAKTWHAQGSGNMALFHYPFTGDLTPLMGASTRNAVAFNLYQQGKTLFAGFDLLAQATALNASAGANVVNPFGDLLLKALEAVQPNANLMQAGKVVPIIISSANTGTQAASGQTQLSLSPDFKMINPAEFVAITMPVNTATVWAAPLTLAPGGQASHTLYLQLPPAGAQAILQMNLQTGAAPNWVNRFEKSLVLVPQ